MARARRRGTGLCARCSFVLLLLALFAPARSSAQPAPAPEAEQEAGAHFDRGVELYSEGNLEGSLVEFERAYELTANYRMLYNLAQVQAERNQYVAALGLFEKYLAEGGTEIADARREETLAELGKLRERVAELTVETNVQGAELFVNGEARGTLPAAAPILIDPGVCEVRVEKAGYLPAGEQLKVTGGARARLALTLRAAEGPDQDAPAPRATRANYKPFWISAGSALALGGATVAFGLQARVANRDLDAELDRFPARADELEQRRSRLKTYAALTDGFGAAAAVSLGLALYFLIDPPRASQARDLSFRSVRLVPRATGLALRAQF